MSEKEPILVFDETSKEAILRSIGLKTNEESKIVDETGKVLTDQEFEAINSGNFGGILMGSKVAIKKETSELAKYFISRKDL